MTRSSASTTGGRSSGGSTSRRKPEAGSSGGSTSRRKPEAGSSGGSTSRRKPEAGSSGGSTSRRNPEAGSSGRSAHERSKAPADGPKTKAGLNRPPFSPWILGFRGHRIPQGFRDSASRGDLLGILLFRDNLGQDWSAARELVRELQRAAPKNRPLLFLADEEGGLISQTTGLQIPGGGVWPAVPTPRALGRSVRPADARWVGALLGRRLRSLGIRLALSPCLDLDTERENPVIGSRSFAPDPETASEFAWAFSRGLADSGVGCAFKHYPGHGGTRKDSHLDLPAMDRADLDLHEQPFRLVLERAARTLGPGGRKSGRRGRTHGAEGVVDAGERGGRVSLQEALRTPFLMPAHVDWGGSRPASLDPDLLRRPRHWLPGVPMITDALDMKAVDLDGGAAETALLAGNDLLLVGREWDAGLKAARSMMAARRGNDPLSRALVRAGRRAEPLCLALASAGSRPSGAPPEEDQSRLMSLHLRCLRLSEPPPELPEGGWLWLVPEGLAPYAHLRDWQPPTVARRKCEEVVWIPGQANPAWAEGISRRLSGDPRPLLLATLLRGLPDQEQLRVLAPLLRLPGLRLVAHLLDEGWPRPPEACVARTSGPSKQALEALALGLGAPDSAWEKGLDGWHLLVDKPDITLA